MFPTLAFCCCTKGQRKANLVPQKGMWFLPPHTLTLHTLLACLCSAVDSLAAWTKTDKMGREALAIFSQFCDYPVSVSGSGSVDPLP